jgi:Protein of unknown function (DUF1553)/Protein of unknown function (DUF1549)/Planctomycete cytochrome C
MGRFLLPACASISIWLGCGFSVPAQGAQGRTSSEAFDLFEKKIRPLLANRCYRCHSARATKLKGGLRLDSREGMLAGGDSGPALVPGDPDRSRLIQAVRYTDPDLKMPPDRKLAPEEVADLEAWVKRGAPAPSVNDAPRLGTVAANAAPARWAFERPREPSLPQVRRPDWIRNPIDRFILAGLESRGQQPAPPADKRTLLRRVTYDLTGLPPTPEELDTFLADESPQAFARVVDRLLASPRYGERWGRHWLDLVRYTDDFDEDWRYRDWVINAFNRDLRYDRFVVQQIAGDRLPAREPGGVNAEGIIATTMLAIGTWGGIDRKKRMADIVDDQIDTIGRTFMGLTLACARCHDHKFDPITTADYYGLAGIFYSSRVISDTVYLSHGTHRLRIPLVSAAEVEKHRQHLAKVRKLEKRLQDEVERHYAAFAGTLLADSARYFQAAWEYQHRPADQAGISVQDFAAKRKLHAFALSQWIHYLGGRRLADFRPLHIPVRDYDGEHGIQVWGASAERPWWGVNSTQHEVAIETFLLPPRTVSVNPGVEGGAVGWRSPMSGRVRVSGRLVDADPHDGVGVSWAVDHLSGGVRRELSSGSMPNGGALPLDQGRHASRLQSIEVKPGDVIYLQVWLRESDAHYDITNVDFTITRLDAPGRWDLTGEVVDNLLEGNPHCDTQGHTGVWSFHDMAGSGRKERLPALDRALAALEPALQEAAAGKRAAEWPAQVLQTMIDLAGADSPLVQDLTSIRSPFWVRERDDARYLPKPAQQALAQRAAELETARQNTPPLPCAHGIQEGGARFSVFPGVGDARIHVRGSYSQLGATVPRHLPRVLSGDKALAIASGSGRLELARWIGSAEHPLTARVMVNRIWQQHFGEGIVRTPSNFGRMGTPPTHPELLDWLAHRFVESGWSVKALHRLILLSAAYQQSSRPSPELLRVDPDNLLFGRMKRRRLEAEALRDSLLAVCDRLDQRAGGPPEDSHSRRRAVYLKVSRGDRAGFGTLFDAADASIHVEKRTASTVAPQALYLMNGWLSMEGLQGLADRAKRTKGANEDRIQALYRIVFGRRATAEEVALGREFIESLAAAPTGPSQDPALLGPWETYAQALLLSNEFLFVD